jgi:cation-transporting ATPase 13A3/4/5
MRSESTMTKLLLHTRIFARVKPDQKVAVVEMHIAQGLITGMCGDGGNDCGALRAAHSGIALSDAEASVVSPFTSKSKSVASVVDLLCEGRCSLATSFAAYRFYITYGLLWSITKTVNFVYGVRMPITGYLTIDSVSAVWIAWAITLARPLDYLLPYRPTSSLFSPQIVLSILVPWAMWMFMLGVALVLQQNRKGHVKFPAHLTKGVGYWELGDSWESTVFVTFMVFPLTWSGMVFSLGTKFRSVHKFPNAKAHHNLSFLGKVSSITRPSLLSGEVSLFCTAICFSRR